MPVLAVLSLPCSCASKAAPYPGPMRCKGYGLVRDRAMAAQINGMNTGLMNIFCGKLLSHQLQGSRAAEKKSALVLLLCAILQALLQLCCRLRQARLPALRECAQGRMNVTPGRRPASGAACRGGRKAGRAVRLPGRHQAGITGSWTVSWPGERAAGPAGGRQAQAAGRAAGRSQVQVVDTKGWFWPVQNKRARSMFCSCCGPCC